MSELLIKASDDAARMHTHEVVTHLLQLLGPTLTAYVAGSTSRALPSHWAVAPSVSSIAEPSDGQARRLRAAHTALLLIAGTEDSRVARNWLISANPRLDGRTPVELLREDRAPVVFSAADAYVADTYYA